MSVGKKIKLYLAKNRITQYWLSNKTHIAMPKLNASLNDKRKISIEEYVLIITALNLEPNYFIN